MNERKINRNLLLWIVAVVISTLGSSFSGVALSVVTYSITGSGKYAAIVFIARLIPPILIGPFAGVFTDNSSKKVVIIMTDLIQALILLSMVLLPQSPWIYFVGNFFLSICEVFFGSASKTMLPELIKNKDLLMRVNGVIGICARFSAITGLSLGGALLAFVDFKSLFILDCFTFIIAIVIVFFIEFPTIDTSNTKRGFQKGYFKLLAEGAHVFYQNKILATALLIFSIVSLFNGLVFSHLVVYVKEHLEIAESFVGLFTSFYLAGVISSKFIVSYFLSISKISEQKSIFGGVLISALILILMGATDHTALALGLYCLYGFFGSFIMLHWVTLSQRIVPFEYRGRVITLADAYVKIVNLLGVAFAILCYNMLKVNIQFIALSLIGLVVLSVCFLVTPRKYLLKAA